MIATAMCKVAPRPTAKDIRAVASHIGEKYPLALRDPVATSSGASTFHGLAHKIECRIVNARRGCKRLAVELAGGATKRATVRTTYGCTEWQPPVESINKDECERVKKILAAENLKAQEEQDIEIQDDLMKAVYPAMRLTINTLNNRASDIRREWPLLFTRQHFLAHFKRLTSTHLEGLFTEKRVVDLELLHAFLRHHVKTDRALQWLAMTERAAREQNRPAALLTGLFPMLCLFFKEKATFLFRTLEGPNLPRARLNHQDALFPRHGKATHSQTWAGEPAWLGVRGDATLQTPAFTDADLECEISLGPFPAVMGREFVSLPVSGRTAVEPSPRTGSAVAGAGFPLIFPSRQPSATATDESLHKELRAAIPPGHDIASGQRFSNMFLLQMLILSATSLWDLSRPSWDVNSSPCQFQGGQRWSPPREPDRPLPEAGFPLIFPSRQPSATATDESLHKELRAAIPPGHDIASGQRFSNMFLLQMLILSAKSLWDLSRPSWDVNSSPCQFQGGQRWSPPREPDRPLPEPASRSSSLPVNPQLPPPTRAYIRSCGRPFRQGTTSRQGTVFQTCFYYRC
ncbi:uncharacterized protein ISCGN_011149 [Ixodes scapularis]